MPADPTPSQYFAVLIDTASLLTLILSLVYKEVPNKIYNKHCLFKPVSRVPLSQTVFSLTITDSALLVCNK